MKSLADIDRMVTEMYDHDTKATSLRKQASLEDERAMLLKTEIMKELAAQGVSSFEGTVGKVYISKRFGVKFPKDPEVKEALHAYLTDKGVFNELWSINYQSLNSWFKEEMEAAQFENRYLDIPGLNPTTDEILNFKKSAKGPNL